MTIAIQTKTTAEWEEVSVESGLEEHRSFCVYDPEFFFLSTRGNEDLTLTAPPEELTISAVIG